LTYLGDTHVSSVQKLWEKTGEGRKVKTSFGKQKMVDPRMNFAKMMYIYRPKNTETAEDQI
jgi:hypothetical protein